MEEHNSFLVTCLSVVLIALTAITLKGDPNITLGEIIFWVTLFTVWVGALIALFYTRKPRKKRPKRIRLFRKVYPPAYEGTVWTQEHFWHYAGWRHPRTTYTHSWCHRTPLSLYIFGFEWRRCNLTYRTDTKEMFHRNGWYFNPDDGRIYNQSRWDTRHAVGEDVSYHYGY